ncbi:SHOCT domain-containing protein [Kitasatospora sp. NPDC097605]|uniref:SHOCT domain-containing protein n=1 Tax=Kitasatospora sp. NPDC097605 TaxID=3157226 RepID=UPI00331E41FE
MATDHPAALGPRLSSGRIVGLLLISAFTATAGWLTATGFVHAYATGACGPERRCDGLGTAGYLAGGILLWLLCLVATATTAHGDAPTTEPSATSDRGVLLGCLALGLLGAALANGSFHPWALLPVLPLALLTAVLDRHGARRWHAFRLEGRRRAGQRDRLERFGVTVPARVTDLTPADTDTGLRVTVGFTTLDGAHRTATVTDTFPAHETPRRGGRAEVRYDPADPENTHVSLAAADPEPAGTVPADALEVVAALERLAALHRDGALDTAEFAAAKARLLGTGSASGHPPYPPRDAVVHPVVRPGTDGPH